jgi:dTDP-4-dehydrorhamnose reductase
MRVVVTGVNGQVGHELATLLATHCATWSAATTGIDLIALDRSYMDLADLAQVRDVLRELRPSLIINPAAHTAVDLAESEPDLAMRINGEAPAVIAEEARRLGAALIHYSTDYVFDGSKDGPYLETDATAPLNVYGRSKLAGEEAIRAAGIPHLILRTSWVYGNRGKNFLKTIQRLAAERDALRIVADQYGAPTWSRTIARGTMAAVSRLCAPANPSSAAWAMTPQRWQDEGGTLHLTAQGSTSWHGFASAIVAGGPRAGLVRVDPIASAEYPVPAPRPVNSRLSCDRFMDRFGALPQWSDALDECLHGTAA